MAKGSSSVNKAVKKTGQVKKRGPAKTPAQPSSSILSTLKRAHRAHAKFKYEEAFTLFTQAIDRQPRPAREFDARDARSDLFWHIGDTETDGGHRKDGRLARPLKDRTANSPPFGSYYLKI
jgi:hypothetical protein